MSSGEMVVILCDPEYVKKSRYKVETGGMYKQFVACVPLWDHSVNYLGGIWSVVQTEIHQSQ